MSARTAQAVYIPFHLISTILFALVAKFQNVFEISLQPTHNGPIQRPLATILSLVSPEQSESLLLQKHWTLPCPNLPALRSPPYCFQNQTEARPIRRRCLPNIGRLRGQRADASTGHAEAFAADSCSDLLVFLLDMNNAPFVIDSVFISLSLIKGAYQSETGVIL